MFDTIYFNKDEISLALPKKIKNKFDHINWEEVDFQTKDLENTLTSFKVKNGKLYYEKVNGEQVRVISEVEEKKKRKKGEFCWPYEFKVKSRSYKLFKHTGDVEFYTHIADVDGDEWWVDFTIKLVDGVQKGKIKLIRHEIFRTAKEIAKQEKEFEEMLQKQKKSFAYKFKKFMNLITFDYWRQFWRKVYTGLSFINAKIIKLQFFISRHLV